MKSLLQQELRELARKILQASDTAELLSLQNDVRVLYEKLIVLRYTDGLVEELRHTLVDAPAGQDEPTPGPISREEEASPSEIDREQPVSQSQPRENIPPQEKRTPAAPVSRATEKPSSSRSRERTPSYDDLQQSLFGDDLFTKELNFDPDEDLFEVLQPSPETAPSRAGLDPEGPLPQAEEDETSPAPSSEAAPSYVGLDPEGPLPQAEEEEASPAPSSEAAPSYAALDPEGPLPQAEEEEASPAPSPETAPSRAGLDPEGPLPQAEEEDALPAPSSETAPSRAGLDPEGPLPQAEEEEASPAPSPEDSAGESTSEPEERETSFFSFQVIRGEEEEADPIRKEESESRAEAPDRPDDEPAVVREAEPQPSAVEFSSEEGREQRSEEEAVAPECPEEGSEGAEPLQPAPAETAEVVSQPQADESAACRKEERESAPHPRTINEAAAVKQQENRPSLNQILSAGNARMEMNDRIAFINNLFDGDAEAFEAAVRYIFSLTDIAVANEYIIEILKPSYNNWFEKEKYERRFVEIVLRHFLPKDYRY